MTQRFFITIGVTPGYFHTNESAKVDFVGTLAKEWQEIMEKDGDENGVYAPAIAMPSLTVYHRQWGCPEGGEQVVAFCGTRNALFVPDAAAWKAAVIRIVEKLKIKLEQKTAQIDFHEVEMTYLQ